MQANTCIDHRTRVGADRRLRTRRKLLQTAFQLFAEQGLDAALLVLQVQYTMFYSVAVVCGLRGLYLGASNLWATFSERETSPVGVLQSSTAA